MTVAVDAATNTSEEVEVDTSRLPTVPCEMLAHEEYGDGPATYRAVLRHDDPDEGCGRRDLVLSCEACLITAGHPDAAWICVRCKGVVTGPDLVTQVARLLGRA